MESPFHASRKPPEDHEFTIEDILRDRYIQQLHPPVDVGAPKTQPVAAKAETIAAEAKMIAVETEPVAAEAEMIAVETEPVAAEAEMIAVEAEPVAAEAEMIAVEAEPVAVEDVSQKEGPPVAQKRSAGTAVKGQHGLAEMVPPAPESSETGVKSADEPGAVAEDLPVADPQVIEAAADAAEKPEVDMKAVTEPAAADAAKSEVAREDLWGDMASVEDGAREVAGSGSRPSQEVPSWAQEDADHGITHKNGAGELSYRSSASRFAPAPAVSSSTLKNGKKKTMKSLFHTLKPQEVAEAGPGTSLSEAVPSRTKENEDHGVAHGNGARGLKFWDAADGVVNTSARKVDNSRIKNEVVLAQRLSREQERGLHFVIQRYRLLCNRLVEVAQNLHSRVFLITSALAEEGKTLTTTNLAFALSEIEHKRSLLIDLDLRRYTLHSVLGIPPSNSEPLFLETEDWHTCLWSLRPNLDALLPTRPVEQVDQLLRSEAMQNLLVAARQEYDYVLIDSAPLLLAADTHALLPIIDQALLVVRADHTPITCSQDALKILGDKAVGCILNDVKRMKYESYYHGYYGTDD